MAGWRPIETAPKDGTRVLVYQEDEASDMTPQIAWWITWHGEEGWHICWDNEPLQNNSAFAPPTHWAPLPEPPASVARLASEIGRG